MTPAYQASGETSESELKVLFPVVVIVEGPGDDQRAAIAQVPAQFVMLKLIRKRNCTSDNFVCQQISSSSDN